MYIVPKKYPGHHPGLSLAENVHEMVKDLAHERDEWAALREQNIAENHAIMTLTGPPRVGYSLQQEIRAQLEETQTERGELRAELERLKFQRALRHEQAEALRAEVATLKAQAIAAPVSPQAWWELSDMHTRLTAKLEKAEAALLSAEAKIRAWPSGRDFDPEDALRILRGPAPAVPGPDHGSPDPAAPVSRRDTACDGSDVGLGCDCGHAERHAPPEEKP